MKRVVKDPKIRQAEILTAAGELFESQGYANTTIEAIIQKAGIAKGTFYYYFKSKEDILDALVQMMVDKRYEVYKKIADAHDMKALEKLRMMLGGENQLSKKEADLMENLHLPENRELHERANVEFIVKISPLFAQVIEQGKREGVFDVENPLETVQFFLSGSQFLLESGLFNWTQDEYTKRIIAMQSIIERSLGAEPGSFSFI
ncbi:MAG TPA: TetR/AcrR family transcriptional regulator [Clostridia bacterium]